MELDDLLADIADRFRAERQARHWSQTEFAQRTGLALNTIKRMEGGKSVSMAVYFAACQEFNQPLTRLLSDDWRIPKQIPTLAPYQIRALEAVAKGGSLAEAGVRIGITRQAMASIMSRIYDRWGVQYKYGIDRKTEVLRIAREYNLIKEETDG